ncbi:MAG: RluA family pseudouridine synthase [Saprospiraceae bacterium]|nr:MAG: RluA family pseudouridine synthase [Saprospiraceae bacterium]
MSPDIIFEDDHLIIVSKPSGILSIPDRHDPSKANMQDMLSRKYGKIFTVHRIDRETSGIMCFAKTAEVHAALSNMFQQREVEKTYLAFVSGNVQPEEGSIEAALMPDPLHSGRMKVSPTGKKSLTTYKVIERFKNCCLVEAGILTGRMHQIRVHFKYIGHPCLVDKLYGTNEAIFIRDIKLKNLKVVKSIDTDERPLVARTTLHAFRLKLVHPATEKEMIFEAPFPKDLKALLNQLRKWA